MSAAHEFRVLSGVHADARCPVAGEIAVGRDPAGDVVLDDAQVPDARLRVGESGWALTRGDAVQEHAWNAPAQLGEVWITVARPEDPWPLVPTPVVDPAPAAPAAITIDADAAALAGMPAPPIRARDEAPTAGTAPVVPRRRGRWLVAAALALLVLAVAIALAVAAIPSPPPAPVVATPRLDPGAASVAAIEQALDRLGMRPALQVTRGANGVVTVSGWVRDRAEEERVSAAMARIWPMPAMRLLNRAEIAGTAQSVLQPYSYRYLAAADERGNLRVRGVAADAAQRSRALAALNAQLPGIGVDAKDVVLAQQVSDALYAELAAAGLGDVRLMWQTDRLEPATAGLDAAQRERLRRVVAAFNPRYLDIVAVPAEAVAAPQAPAPTPVATRVPFRIRSVVGGPQPFLVLGDGSKLVPGGSFGKYRLASIEADRIVFDQPQPTVVAR